MSLCVSKSLSFHSCENNSLWCYNTTINTTYIYMVKAIWASSVPNPFTGVFLSKWLERSLVSGLFQDFCSAVVILWICRIKHVTFILVQLYTLLLQNRGCLTSNSFYVWCFSCQNLQTGLSYKMGFWVPNWGAVWSTLCPQKGMFINLSEWCWFSLFSLLQGSNCTLHCLNLSLMCAHSSSWWITCLVCIEFSSCFWYVSSSLYMSRFGHL